MKLTTGQIEHFAELYNDRVVALAAKLAERWHYTDVEELQSRANAALFEALSTFECRTDERKSREVWAKVSACVTARLTDELRAAQRREKRTHALPQATYNKASHETDDPVCLRLDDAGCDGVDARDWIDNAKALTDTERRVMQLRLYNGYDCKEIACELKISHEAARQAWIRGRNKMREAWR